MPRRHTTPPQELKILKETVMVYLGNVFIACEQGLSLLLSGFLVIDRQPLRSVVYYLRGGQLNNSFSSL